VAARVNGGRFRAVSSSIDVVINGKARTVAVGTTVLGLLGELGLGDKRVAVERNLEVFPRALHATTTLTDGDRLEVVTFVGGG
jgi:sulfur carrier protein